MSNSEFWFEERVEQTKEQAPTQNVLDLLELFKALSLEEKIQAKRLIISEKMFGN